MARKWAGWASAGVVAAVIGIAVAFRAPPPCLPTSRRFTGSIRVSEGEAFRLAVEAGLDTKSTFDTKMRNEPTSPETHCDAKTGDVRRCWVFTSYEPHWAKMCKCIGDPTEVHVDVTTGATRVYTSRAH